MFFSSAVISQIAQSSQASAASQVSADPVVTGSLEVPEHPVHPVVSPQGTEVLVDSVHSGEVPAGEVAVPSSSIPISGVPGHTGEVPAGVVAVPISSDANIGIGGPAGEGPARDIPVPRVMCGVPFRVLPVGEGSARVPVPIAVGGDPPVVQPEGELPERATSGGKLAAPLGVGEVHPPCSLCLSLPCVSHLCVSYLSPVGRWGH